MYCDRTNVIPSVTWQPSMAVDFLLLYLNPDENYGDSEEEIDSLSSDDPLTEHRRFFLFPSALPPRWFQYRRDDCGKSIAGEFLVSSS
jgi:hypothetical protein